MRLKFLVKGIYRKIISLAKYFLKKKKKMRFKLSAEVQIVNSWSNCLFKKAEASSEDVNDPIDRTTESCRCLLV